MIKTFRGIMVHNTEQKIRLSTKKGKIGYKIHKFQIMSNSPTTASAECVIQIFKISQSTVSYTVDFSDGNLLGAAVWSTNATSEANPEDSTIIFDREVFNQDIFLTHYNTTGSETCNYYLELEVMDLSDNAAAVSTLRDIRLNPQVGA
jgi:hypothetical protein